MRSRGAGVRANTHAFTVRTPAARQACAAACSVAQERERCAQEELEAAIAALKAWRPELVDEELKKLLPRAPRSSVLDVSSSSISNLSLIHI